MRFARNVEFKIKSGKEQEFHNLFQKEVVPKLQKQDGFREELLLLKEGRRESKALGISLWNDKQSAEKYQQETYPKVFEALSPLIDGTPQVEHCEVNYTTLR